MLNRLKVILDQPEYSALLQVAIEELRSPDDQVRYMVRQELMRRGLLRTEQSLDQQAAYNAKYSA